MSVVAFGIVGGGIQIAWLGARLFIGCGRGLHIAWVTYIPCEDGRPRQVWDCADGGTGFTRSL